MNEEEQKLEKEEEAPVFPYPYPTVRCIACIFLIFFMTKMAGMWDGGISKILLGAGIGICMIATVYLFITGYKGQIVRREYAFKMDQIRRKEINEKLEAEAKEKKQREQAESGK